MTIVLQVVQEKSKIELQVKVKGDPMPEVKWFRDGKELAATIKIKIVTKDDTSTLTVNNATKAASGTYKVVAKNKLGQVEHTAKVDVTGLLRCTGVCEVVWICGVFRCRDGGRSSDNCAHRRLWFSSVCFFYCHPYSRQMFFSSFVSGSGFPVPPLFTITFSCVPLKVCSGCFLVP